MYFVKTYEKYPLNILLMVFFYFVWINNYMHCVNVNSCIYYKMGLLKYEKLQHNIIRDTGSHKDLIFMNNPGP